MAGGNVRTQNVDVSQLFTCPCWSPIQRLPSPHRQQTDMDSMWDALMFIDSHNCSKKANNNSVKGKGGATKLVLWVWLFFVCLFSVMFGTDPSFSPGHGAREEALAVIVLLAWKKLR